MAQAQVLAGQVPYSVEAEEAVIGSVLIDPEAFYAVGTFLKPDDFYMLRHTYIWEAIDRLNQRGDQIDYLTVQEELRACGRLAEIGGPAYLTQLINATPTSAHAAIYGEIVRRGAVRRRLLAAADEIKALALDEELPIERVESEAASKLMNAQKTGLSQFISMREAAARHYDRVEEAMRNPKELLGIPSSLKAINDFTKGYRRKKLYVVAGRPGMGKSSFLYTEAAFMAAQGLPVALFTLEVGEEEVTDFLIAGVCGIQPDRFNTGDLSDQEWKRYVSAVGKVSNWPLLIDDVSGLTPSEFLMKCMRLKHEIGLAAVFVDYLQLMSGGREIRYDGRDQEIGYISRTLKKTAKEVDIPIIAAAQLSRNVENREDKHPQLSDLRESGNIENDSDVVMLFYRDDYYNPPPVPNVISPTDVGIAKHRGGKTGMTQIGFYGMVKKFVELQRDTDAERRTS